MNLVFLSPHFPPNFYLFCCRLRELGVNVLGLAEAPYDDLRPELKSALTEYFRVDSLENYESVMRACGYLISRYGRLNVVESHNEHWLMLEGRIREDFNIPGPKVADTEKIKRKSMMKRIFREAGVPVARGEMLADLAQARRFVASVGFPIIAKPDIGVGAWGTVKIANDEQLVAFFENRPPVDYLVEEFINGSLETFDGITDQDGKIVFVTSHLSATGVLEVVTDNADLFYHSVRDIPVDLLDLGSRTVTAFGVRQKFFHIEFLRQHHDKRLVVMEVNIRPPGGFSTDMMNFACDTDVYREWAHIVVENRMHPYERRYHCAHVARKFGKEYRHSHDEIVQRFGDRICAVSEVAPVFSAVMGNVAYLVRSTDMREIHDMVAAIQAKA